MRLHCNRFKASPSANPAQKIVLLHGMGGTGALWRPLAIGLESMFESLAPDQRGHGKSRTAEAGFGPLDYGRDIVETLEAENFRPAWVLGHSMGVRSAVAYAHLEPASVLGLVLIDIGFSGPAGGGLGDGLAAFLKVLPKRFESRALAKNFMAEKCPDPSIAQYLLAVSVPEDPKLPAGPVTFPFDHASLIATIDAARDSSIRPWIEDFARTGKPVIVLRGGRSLVWSKEEFEAEKVHFNGYPSVQFHEFEDASHGLPFEKRMELAKLVIETATASATAAVTVTSRV